MQLYEISWHYHLRSWKKSFGFFVCQTLIQLVIDDQSHRQTNIEKERENEIHR
jgi:hypothetical protein